MAMRYANEADVVARLKLTEAADIERAVRLEAGLADLMDAKTGRTFGVAPTAVTRTYRTTHDGDRPWLMPIDPIWVYGYTSSRYSGGPVVFPVPIRTLQSVASGGTWNGTTWTDTTAVTTDEYRAASVDRDGRIWGLQFDGGAPDFLHVTAIWDDQSTPAVPADIREAMTFLTIDSYRIGLTSPAGSMGPDGLILQVRDPWNMKLVQAAIDNHRLIEIVV